MSKGPKNSLTGSEKMQLALWGAQNKDRLKDLSKFKAMELIEAELKFKPTPHAVKDLYNLLGLRIISTRSKIPNSVLVKGKVELKVRVLSRIVKKLFVEVGIPVPPVLDALIIGQQLGDLNETEQVNQEAE